MSEAGKRLHALGLELPPPPAPQANYVPVRSVPIGDGRILVFVAGQIARRPDGSLYTGRVPSEVSVEEAVEAARACGLAILAQLEAAGGMDAVEAVLQVTGFVACADGFGEQPRVINGCSDLLVEVLGEPGRHSRAALGTNSLPLGVPVEVAAVAVLRST